MLYDKIDLIIKQRNILTYLLSILSYQSNIKEVCDGNEYSGGFCFTGTVLCQMVGILMWRIADAAFKGHPPSIGDSFLSVISKI